MCKADIRECLYGLGVSEHDLIEREFKDDERIVYDSLCEHDTENLTGEEVVSMIAYQVATNPKGLFYVFRDILVDRIWDARNHFLAISSARGGNGVFVYWFEWSDIIAFALDPTLSSQAVWTTKKTDNAPITDIVDSLIERVQPHAATDFGVILCVFDEEKEEVLSVVRVLTTDLERKNEFIEKAEGGGFVSGVTDELRPAYHDIIRSLTKGMTCRCSGHQPSHPNPEFQWAKKINKRIKKRAAS